jgi:hypothetical protein
MCNMIRNAVRCELRRIAGRHDLRQNYLRRELRKNPRGRFACVPGRNTR